MEAQDPVRVRCYSGGMYAERPESFEWKWLMVEVVGIDRAWLEPGERHFRVATDVGAVFDLCYSEGNDRWSAVVVSGSACLTDGAA